jgi:hypothetical protein
MNRAVPLAGPRGNLVEALALATGVLTGAALGAVPRLPGGNLT